MPQRVVYDVGQLSAIEKPVQQAQSTQPQQEPPPPPPPPPQQQQPEAEATPESPPPPPPPPTPPPPPSPAPVSPPTCDDNWSSNPTDESKEVNEDVAPSPADQVPPSPLTIGNVFYDSVVHRNFHP